MSSDGFAISKERLAEVNDFLTMPGNRVMDDLLAIVEKHGGVEAINTKAREAGKLERIISRMEEKKLPQLEGLNWLMDQRDTGAFVSMDDYRKGVLGDRYGTVQFDDDLAVTLEISSCHYFDYLLAEARQPIEKKELMPGRYIRVRFMKEQEADGDLLAMTAAKEVLGCTICETLDTKGTDGSNIHLGGADTITGYFGGVGQPNTHALKWADEFLYYYTNYGVKQVLNINPGTVLLGYLMHKLGIDIEFKISVFMGNDNPYAVLWTLMAARLLAREDGTTPLIGFNFSNSVNNGTIDLSSYVRSNLGLEENVRFEHHILETFKAIVIQPYDRREELMELAASVPNISAKHEGGIPDVDGMREHPSSILDYFMKREDIEAQGLMDAFTRNYLDKHDGLNSTARMLTEKGFSVIPAWNLHK